MFANVIDPVVSTVEGWFSSSSDPVSPTAPPPVSPQAVDLSSEFHWPWDSPITASTVAVTGKPTTPNASTSTFTYMTYAAAALVAFILYKKVAHS